MAETYGNTGGAPAKQAAAQRVSRYYNKASGKMETAQAMHGYRPAGHSAPSRPQQAGGREPAPIVQQSRSLIQMSPREIEARAAQIVDSEIKGARLPFEQRHVALQGEQIAQLGAHQVSTTQQDTALRGLQTQQAASAKTYQNQAADAVKKAGEAAPGAAEAREHLGGAEPESLTRQREAARTLLTGIAAAGQAATNTRQQDEANYLTNTIANAGQQAVFGGKQIESEYAKRQQENAGQQAQVEAKRTGATSKLAQALFGEQEKLKIASAGLGVKEGNLQRQDVETASNITRRSAQTKNEGTKIAIDKKYKEANQGTKNLKDSLDIKKKEIDIRKALEGPNPTGKPLTKPQVSKYAMELSAAFNVFRRAREAGASPQSIREALEQGGHRHIPTEGEIAAEQKQRGITFSTKELEARRKGQWLKNPTVKNPVFLKAAEDIMQKEYIGTDTKKEMREMGLPDSGWSERFLGKPSPGKGLKGGVQAGGKK